MPQHNSTCRTRNGVVAPVYFVARRLLTMFEMDVVAKFYAPYNVRLAFATTVSSIKPGRLAIETTLETWHVPRSCLHRVDMGNGELIFLTAAAKGKIRCWRASVLPFSRCLLLQICLRSCTAARPSSATLPGGTGEISLPVTRSYSSSWPWQERTCCCPS